jgi:hypothetical protein
VGQRLGRVVALAVPVGDMGVEVDQPGQYPFGRPVDHCGTVRGSWPRTIIDDLAVG